MVRVRQARPEGVAQANQWLTPRKSATGSNLVDMGRLQCTVSCVGADSPAGVQMPGGEAAVKVCGVAVAMLPG